jgi:hypothetical protein
MGGLPKQLEAEWRARHTVSAQAAFERAAQQGQAVAAPSFFAATADSSAEPTGAAASEKTAQTPAPGPAA